MNAKYLYLRCDQVMHDNNSELFFGLNIYGFRYIDNIVECVSKHIDSNYVYGDDKNIDCYYFQTNIDEVNDIILKLYESGYDERKFYDLNSTESYFEEIKKLAINKNMRSIG